MKKLVFTALVCGGLLQMGTGCIITTSSSEDDGEFDVAWIVDSADENRNPVEVICPAEYDVQFVAATSDLNNPDYDILFNCDANRGLTGSIRAGSYDTFVNVLDRNGDLVAQSAVQSVTVPLDTVVELDFRFYLDQGTFGFAWELVNGANQVEPCNVDESVTAVSTLSANELPFEDIYNCDAGDPISGLLPVGDYTIALQLLDALDQPVDGATGVINSAVIDIGNAHIDLASVDIPVP